jgi:hypothetical protein
MRANQAKHRLGFGFYHVTRLRINVHLRQAIEITEAFIRGLLDDKWDKIG